MINLLLSITLLLASLVLLGFRVAHIANQDTLVILRVLVFATCWSLIINAEAYLISYYAALA